MSDMNFRKFLDEARNNAIEVSGQAHVAAEAKTALKDLVEISYQVEKLLGERLENGADGRVLQKRYDALKITARESDKKLAYIRESISGEVLNIIREMAGDAQLLIEEEKSGEVKSAGAAATRLKMSLKRLTEVLTSF